MLFLLKDLLMWKRTALGQDVALTNSTAHAIVKSAQGDLTKAPPNTLPATIVNNLAHNIYKSRFRDEDGKKSAKDWLVLA